MAPPVGYVHSQGNRGTNVIHKALRLAHVLVAYNEIIPRDLPSKESHLMRESFESFEEKY